MFLSYDSTRKKIQGDFPRLVFFYDGRRKLCWVSHANVRSAAFLRARRATRNFQFIQFQLHQRSFHNFSLLPLFILLFHHFFLISYPCTARYASSKILKNYLQLHSNRAQLLLFLYDRARQKTVRSVEQATDDFSTSTRKIVWKSHIFLADAFGWMTWKICSS